MKSRKELPSEIEGIKFNAFTAAASNLKNFDKSKRSKLY
mgnify:CR=1 FL=1